MKSIRLIRIDESLSRIVHERSGDFAKAYGASLGGSQAVVREVVSQTLALLEKAPRSPEWGGYLAADQEQGMVIGTCGYKHGPEADGTVEIAYYTFPEFEARGYASAMAAELLRRALESKAVRSVVACTLPERNASTRVLEKIGLHRVGEGHDLDVGRVWLWADRRI